MTHEQRQFAGLTIWFLLLLALPAVVFLSAAGWFAHLHSQSSAWHCSCGLVAQYAHPLAGLYSTILLWLGLSWVGLIGGLLAWRLLTHRRKFGQTISRAAVFISGGRRISYLLEAGTQPTAVTTGLLRPCIRVSQAIFQSLDREELQAVFDHEQEHVRRHDPFLSHCVAMAQQLYFFLPTIRTAAQAWVVLRELTADDAATGHYRHRRGLAGALLKMGDIALEGVPSFSPNVLRVDRLLQPQARLKMRAWRWRYGTLVAGMVLGAIFGARILTTWATAPSSQLVRQCHEISFMCQASPIPQSQIHLPTAMSFYVGQ